MAEEPSSRLCQRYESVVVKKSSIYAFGVLRSALLVSMLAASTVPACKNDGSSLGPSAGQTAAARPLPSAPPAATEPRERESPIVKLDGPGKIPFDFPALRAPAERGDFVLAPPKSWIREALDHGSEAQPFVYYGGWFEQAGANESLVRTLTDQQSVIPNALIIRIARGAQAKAGDIVLTDWASGAGLQRAIVVPGGDPRKPKVHYLDVPLEVVAQGTGQQDVLQENRFTPLQEPGTIGTSMACREGAQWRSYIVVGRQAERLLGLGFAGKMRAFNTNDCRWLPVRQKLSREQTVFVPVIGQFVPGQVARVEPQIGRAWVLYQFGGESKQQAFGYTNIAVEPLNGG